MERKKQGKRRPGEIKMAKLLEAGCCYKYEILPLLKSGLIDSMASNPTCN